ncbi:alginate lyase family protein [Streptomyces sp. FXJ1.4098]|nr:alginate lyase family protein [Streptomyces sp. FXJ1.4098]
MDEPGPWTVTDKDQVPPSGDKHDYFSQAPYWWPTQPKTEDNPYGCPYVQKDGQRNPDVDKMTDRPEVGKVFESAYELSLAWYYTGKRGYAEHAAEILRTWFVDPATRMNPSLNHAQFIPCKYDGRSIGIIDFSQGFTSLLDAAAILDTGAPGWSRGDHAGFRTWNKQFLDWLVNSDFGKEESAAENNHGTFADMQIAAIAAAVGDRDLARQVVREARTKRVDAQIAADGTQPGELSRTRSFHYSTFNLVAFTRLAAVGEHVGVDLWHYTGRAERTSSRPSTYCSPRPPGPSPGRTRSWTSAPTRPATSCTRRPTRATARPRRHSPCSRHRPAATCGRCGRPSSSLTASPPLVDGRVRQATLPRPQLCRCPMAHWGRTSDVSALRGR